MATRQARQEARPLAPRRDPTARASLPIGYGIQLRTAATLPPLLDALATRLAAPLSSPFDVEHVVVPGGPMRDWLAAELADRLGVWCNHAVYPPAMLADRLGVPLPEPPSAWAVRDALAGRLGTPGFEAPTRYLEGDATGIRAIQLATRIASLFANYARFRPEMLARWADGSHSTNDGNEAWQAQLWRDLFQGALHPLAAINAHFADHIPTLPRRLSVFAVDHLAPLELHVLRRLAQHIQVGVFAIATSPLAQALAADAPPKVLPCTLPTPRLLVHATHGKMREVEVLRDALLTLFAGDASLQPEDVLVLAPDINDYAALLDGVFGTQADLSRAPGAQARFPLCFADRSPFVDAPGLAAMRALLALPHSRRPLSLVSELWSIAPVHARFGLSEEDAATARGWLDEAAVRWAEDAPFRERFANPALPQHTWRWGLDRLLLGYAVESDNARLFDDLLPIDGLEGNNAAPLGGLCAFCDILLQHLAVLEGNHTPSQWATVLLASYDALVSTRGPWAGSRLTLVHALEALSGEQSVAIGAVSDWIVGQLEQVERREGFYSGGVNCASLRTGRVIPARVVALLGVDDDRFPRDPTPLAFDLIAQDPQPGDLPARMEDRLTFVNASRAAIDHLHLSYIGHGSRDNKARPPSVVVAELLDALPVAIRAEAAVSHPMQPFSRLAFVDPRVPNYSNAHHLGALALLSPQREPPAFFPTPLSPDPATATVDLAVLVRFFQNPSAAVLSGRLDLRFAEAEAGTGDREPFNLNFLEQWQIGDALVKAGLAGIDPESLWPAMRESGLLPMGTPGRAHFDALAAAAMGVVEAAQDCDAGEAQPNVDLNVELPGARLTGRLDGRRTGGGLYVSYSKLDAKRLLPAWIRHLAANAAGLQPAVTWAVGRAKGGGESHSWADVPEAGRWLRQLLALYAEGMTRPLPFTPKASYAYAVSYMTSQATGTPEADARALASIEALKAWVSMRLPGQDPIPGEGEDPAVARVFDRSVLWSEEFGRVALRVYAPMRGHYGLPESLS
ncbi:hypothetical protein LBMAG42_19930 [Deltaproteobacteria bacterium]|nr:hypothetical protein LBMAG42_19930 [Deltaproteobacteria bacterium]